MNNDLWLYLKELFKCLLFITLQFATIKKPMSLSSSSTLSWHFTATNLENSAANYILLKDTFNDASFYLALLTVLFFQALEDRGEVGGGDGPLLDEHGNQLNWDDVFEFSLRRGWRKQDPLGTRLNNSVLDFMIDAILLNINLASKYRK